jgi:hypothetical protein
MASNVSVESLARDWIHSHEEDVGEVRIFRPAGYLFPPARGRDAIGLAIGGVSRRRGAGPTDQSGVERIGSWVINGNRLTLQELGATDRSFLIESVTPEKLVLRPDTPVSQS